MMDFAEPDLDQRIGERVRALRTGLGLSIEALAQRSGVSRSMISVIERGQSSPTATLLDKVATGLDVSLASLFEYPGGRTCDPVSHRAAQTTWRDPASGYIRRNVSPDGVETPIQIVEVEFPPQARVAYDSGSTGRPVHQQLLVLEGAIEFTVGEATYRLGPGDCVACTIDKPTAFHNPTSETARYIVVLTINGRSKP